MIHNHCSLRTRTVAIFAVMFVGVDSAGAVDFNFGAAEVVYTKGQRKSGGGANWPDGSFGVVANGNGTYDFYGANSSKSVLTTGTLNNPGATKKSVSITGTPKGFSYLAGGPVYEDPYSGARLMLYHAEDGGKGKSFYSSLGMAISTDPEHKTFRDLGIIIKPTLASGNAEVGGGSFAVINGFLNVYYTDWTADGNINFVSTARASMLDVMNNAIAGRSTAFSKYYNGAYSESALGGRSSPLEVGNPANSWAGVSYNEYLNQLVMVSSQWSDDGGDLYLTTSADGVNWAPRQALAVDPGEQFYPSIMGAKGSITGQQFYAYYTDSKKGAWGRWDDAQLRRRSITINSPGAGGVGASDHLGYTADWNTVGDFQDDFKTRGPAAGWKYSWDPKGKLGKQANYVPLLWSEAAQAYNTTGGATMSPNPKKHNDDFLQLGDGFGQPGNSKYLPMAGYTIQQDDGAGFYRLADTSIQLAGVAQPKDDGLNVLVYVNDTLINSKAVNFGSGLVNFDSNLGTLNVGDTIWVMIDPLKSNNNNAFINFDFSIQKLMYSAAGGLFAAAGLSMSTTNVPEPSTLTLLLLAVAAYTPRRRRAV